MSRLPDWRSRLAAYIERVRRAPFAWSTHDCCMFAAGAVEAVTGADPAAELRGTYGDLAGGMTALGRAGFAGPVDMARALFDRVPPALAQVGDVAVVDTPEGPALGVVQGPSIFVVGPEGLRTVDLLAARLAFRV